MSHLMNMNDVAATENLPIIDDDTTWKVDGMIHATRDNPQTTTHCAWRRSQLRIGAVSYLNSKPLVEFLPELCPDAEVFLEVPSKLADQLACENLEVALIPSIEAFLDPSYEIVSDACVATHGPVLSVKLYSRVHPGDIRTLALDEGSRTSAALARIMLNERFGVQPAIQQLQLDRGTQDTDADAILLIGDRAMFSPRETFHTVWDLGEEWVDWTGLPFVFAMWVARSGVELGEVEVNLSVARDQGLRHLQQLAEVGATRLGLPLSKVESYLTKNLHFHLGPAEKMGLKLFHDLAAQNGLAPETPVSFRESLTTGKAHHFSATHC